MKVSMADLPAQYAALKGEMDAAVLSVLATGMFGLTPATAELESRIAEMSGVRYGVALNSGTDALLLSLMALDLSPGDEVITTPFTFVATAEVVALLGLTPVFADIDPATYNLDPQDVRRKITERTKAIIPVHLFGQMADMTALTAIAGEHQLPLIGDAAQAIGCFHHGKPVAQWSLFTTLSFFPTKNLGAAGDGGMVLTDDEAVAEKLRYLRFHGSKGTYSYKYVGLCSRLDAIQTAVLGVKLPHIDAWNEARRQNATFYDAAFAGMGGLVTPCTAPENVHTYHQYTIRVNDGRRDALKAYLSEHEIGSGIYYPGVLHLEEAYRRYGGKPGDSPHAETATAEVLSIPVMPELKAEQREFVADTVRAFFGG
ncbi:MAG: DegT/DnrJ/EryC1/StrS family aminotransferase [Armatimonadetes bacterium]|nr:DegT/DnrJ/EryC1/StrS family aminotransferase [Armatimonadota bacterium]